MIVVSISHCRSVPGSRRPSSAITVISDPRESAERHERAAGQHP
jgi:hypothetical protein